jgi:hypothetical protein
MVMARSAKAQLTKVKVALPFGIGEAEWGPDTSERDAAWSLYVELVTRVAVQPLPEGQGVSREVLSSLHSLFGATRTILRQAGPGVGAKVPSVGGIAVRVLNVGLRPFLSKWHPRLLQWESERSSTTSIPVHEAAWPERAEFEAELIALRQNLEAYAIALGRIAGVQE